MSTATQKVPSESALESRLVNPATEISALLEANRVLKVENDYLRCEVRDLNLRIDRMEKARVESAALFHSIEIDLEHRLDLLSKEYALLPEGPSIPIPEGQTERILANKECQIRDGLEKNRWLQRRIESLELMNTATIEHATNIENELEARNQRLSTISVTDHLTKIYNRLKIHISLNVEIERAKRNLKPLFLFMFDIDHFKRINDQFGHDIGDEVLLEIVKRVNGIIRQGDVFARWGGEEFMVLVPNSTSEDVMTLIVRIRQAIEQSMFPGVGQVTCSFGVTQYAPGEESKILMKRVDEALYQSKHNGRNCVTLK